MCSEAPAPLTSRVHASRSNGCPSRSSPEIRTETAMWIRSDFRWDCQFIVAVNTVATPSEAVKNHVERQGHSPVAAARAAGKHARVVSSVQPASRRRASSVDRTARGTVLCGRAAASSASVGVAGTPGRS